MTKRILVALVAFLLLAYLSLLGAYNIHMLLTGGTANINALVCFAGLVSISKARSFFFIFLLIALLFVLYALFGMDYINYKTKMQRITPKISTPRPEGSEEYGSARWLDKHKVQDAFFTVTVDLASPLLRQLMEEGESEAETCGHDVHKLQKGGEER